MRWLPLLFLATAAHAQAPDSKYLVHPDIATCHARSAAMCVAVGCQKGTTEWWACTELKDGTAAMEIQRSGDFGQSTTKGGKSGTLTNPEISSLKTSAEVAPLMPAAAADAQK